MFGSLSSCPPGNRVATRFSSTKNQNLEISVDIEIHVNGILISERPVALLAQDEVEAFVVAPGDFLTHEFYEYRLDGIRHVFAVVTKNNYIPTVKPVDVPKKWFNYNPTRFLISFKDSYAQVQRPFGHGRGLVDIASTHIVLDHINFAVCFYSTSQELITRVPMIAGPIDYKKIVMVDNVTGESSTEALILCSNGKLYRIRFDNQYYGSDRFSPTVIPIFNYDNLWYEQDLPSGASILDLARQKLRSKINPLVTALDTDGQLIWLAGFDSIWVLDKNFQPLKTISITNSSIVCIACIDNDAIVTTRNGQVYYVRFSGEVISIYQSSVLGTPCSLPGFQEVAIPDPDNQRILIFSGDAVNQIARIWQTPNMAPAYIRMFDGQAWVTGHDTNLVLKINPATGDQTEYYFDSKVTLVSVVEQRILAVHYLQEFITLDLAGIQKIIPFTVQPRQGPKSHIGTEPVLVKMLGEEGILPIAGPDLTCWVNGSTGVVMNTGDYFGVSFKAMAEGLHRRSFVIGETAFDYDITITVAKSANEYYVPTIPTVNQLDFVLPYQTETTPNFGNLTAGTTGPLDIGFDINVFGNVYSQIGISTNGFIEFGNSATLSNSISFGNLSVDALYVELGGTQQLLPISNVNPLNVTGKLMPTGEIPGVYYQTGNNGSFKYFKARWVGLKAVRSGVTKAVTGTTGGSFTIPVDNTEGIQVGDYVSGQNVVVSTRVSSINSMQVRQANVVYSIGITTGNNQPAQRLYLDTVDYPITDIKQYATITSVTGEISYVDRLMNYYYVGPIVLGGGIKDSTLVSVTGNTISLTGRLGSIYTDEFTALIPVENSDGIKTLIKKPDIDTIVRRAVPIQVVLAISSSAFDVSQSDWELLQVDEMIRGPGFQPQTRIVHKYTATFITGVTVYTVLLSKIYSISVVTAGDYVFVDRTDITFESDVDPGVDTDGSLLNFDFGSFVGFELLYIDTTADTNLIPTGGISMQGNFVIVNNSIAAVSAAEMLFNPETDVVPMTYEVGLYTNGDYQFVEYYYDNADHDFSSSIGISSAGGILSAQAQIGSSNSGLFYSDPALGNWKFFGQGHLDSTIGKKLIRSFTPLPSTAESTNQSRIEFTIDQDIVPADNIFMSTSYGYLTVNDAVYTGSTAIKTHDVVSLRIPVNTSLRIVVPIISIGDQQFSVPMISNSIETPINEIVYFYPDQTRNTLTTTGIVIPISDTYYIPDYYTSNALIDNTLQFRLIRDGEETVLTPGAYYDLNAGEELVVTDFLTSPGLFDVRNIDIVGSFVLRLILRTESGPVFEYLDFGTLIDPFVNNYIYTNDSNNTYIDLESYVTANLTLTSSNLSSGNIYVDDLYANIIVDGVKYSDHVSNVPVGSTIAIQRKLFNYYQTSANVYQVSYDSVVASNVYIPIGLWNLSNKIIDNGIKDSVSFESTVQLTQVLSKVNSSLSNFKVTSRLNKSASSAGGTIKIKSTAANDVLIRKLSIAHDTNYVNYNAVLNSVLPGVTGFLLTKSVTNSINNSTYVTANQLSQESDIVSSYLTPRKITPYYDSQSSLIRNESQITAMYVSWDLFIGGRIAADFHAANVIKTSRLSADIIAPHNGGNGKISSIYYSTNIVKNSMKTASLVPWGAIAGGKIRTSYANINIVKADSVTSEYIAWNYVIGGKIVNQDTIHSVTVISADSIQSYYDTGGSYIDTHKINAMSDYAVTLLKETVTEDIQPTHNELLGQVGSAADIGQSFVTNKFESTVFGQASEFNGFNQEQLIEVETILHYGIQASTTTAETLVNALIDTASVVPETIMSNSFDAAVAAAAFIISIPRLGELAQGLRVLLSKLEEYASMSAVTLAATANDPKLPTNASAVHYKFEQGRDELQTEIMDSVGARKAADAGANLAAEFRPIVPSVSTQVTDQLGTVTGVQSSELVVDSELSTAPAYSEVLARLESSGAVQATELNQLIERTLNLVNSELSILMEQTSQYPESESVVDFETISESARTEIDSQIEFVPPAATATEILLALEKIVASVETQTKTVPNFTTPADYSELTTALERIKEIASTEAESINASVVPAQASESEYKLDSFVYQTGSELPTAQIFDVPVSHTTIDSRAVPITPIDSTELFSKNNSITETVVTDVPFYNQEFIGPWTTDVQWMPFTQMEKWTSTISGNLMPLTDSTAELVSWYSTWFNIANAQSVSSRNNEQLTGTTGEVQWINDEFLIGNTGEVQWINDLLLADTTSSLMPLAANIQFELLPTEFKIASNSIDLLTQGVGIKIRPGPFDIERTTESVGFRRSPTLLVISESVSTVRLPTLFQAFVGVSAPYEPRLVEQYLGVSPVYTAVLFVPYEATSIKYMPELHVPNPLELSLRNIMILPYEDFIKPPMVLDVLPERLRKLTMVHTQDAESPLSNEMVLEQDVIWTMDALPENGAYQTFINIWANNGRGGDKLSSLGDPANIGPMVLYSREYKYAPGAYKISDYAEDQSVKYYSAGVMQIPMTDYWNYRIYFNTRHYCIPRKGMLFPTRWYIRGG